MYSVIEQQGDTCHLNYTLEFINDVTMQCHRTCASPHLAFTEMRIGVGGPDRHR